jgi:hypothetical protein
MVLQLCGLGTVGWDIWKRLTQFNRGLQAVARWWQAFPPIYPSVVRSSVGSVTGTGAAQGVSDPWRDLEPEASVESRLKAAEENLCQVRHRLSQFEQEASKNAERLTADIDRESRTRACAVKAIGSQLEETAIGGWQVALMGVVWLAVGLIITELGGKVFSE